MLLFMPYSFQMYHKCQSVQRRLNSYFPFGAILLQAFYFGWFGASLCWYWRRSDSQFVNLSKLRIPSFSPPSSSSAPPLSSPSLAISRPISRPTLSLSPLPPPLPCVRVHFVRVRARGGVCNMLPCIHPPSRVGAAAGRRPLSTGLG